MSRLFEEFWNENFVSLAPCTRQQAYIIWLGCKAGAIKLLKADTRTRISDKKRTWEDALENL